MLSVPEIKLKSFLSLVVVFLVGNIFIWNEDASARKSPAGFYFLDVGQGDSELAVFPSGAKAITDAGPGKQVAAEIPNVLGALDNYIDVAVISHPQLDHYGGFSELLSHYDFGIFIYNGREADSGTREWQSLIKTIKGKNIPILALGAGDKIFFDENKIDFLSPNAKLQADKELNNTALVEKISMGGVRELLTSDISDKVEKALMKAGVNLQADILKVAHHGSKYSTSAAFLKAVSPVAAAIEVGKNTYGHPTKDVLDRLASIGALVFRTDLLGTVGAKMESGSLIFSGR
jgi:beta-lactamase superfamily II metal-dependent hydrolase